MEINFDIKSFNIKNLHGHKNYNLRFKDNSLILVGENGMGKTTVLRLLYHFLSGKWKKLTEFNFDSISAVINNEEVYISQQNLKDGFNSPLKHREILQLLEHRINNQEEDFPDYKSWIKNMTYSYHYNDLFKTTGKTSKDRVSANFISKNILTWLLPLDERENQQPYNQIPTEETFKQVLKTLNEQKKSLKHIEDIIDSIASNFFILYLPTYRRIEKDLKFLPYSPNRDSSLEDSTNFKAPSKNNSLELIEFGMRDVKQSIEKTLDKLKDFTSENLSTLTTEYLNDIIAGEYKKSTLDRVTSIENSDIKRVLDHIDEKMLPQKSKKSLEEILKNAKKGGYVKEKEKIVCHYFTKLLDFQEKLNEKEISINSFCSICNSYMEDKYFEYDSSTFSFKIKPNDETEETNFIDFEELSSGEKQIVSVFNHLYLSEEKRKYIVLIDEPELSLSVKWQRKFLSDIKQSPLCASVIAVTHSPFIYDNNLEDYAHALGEFIVPSTKH